MKETTMLMRHSKICLSLSVNALMALTASWNDEMMKRGRGFVNLADITITALRDLLMTTKMKVRRKKSNDLKL